MSPVTIIARDTSRQTQRRPFDFRIKLVIRDHGNEQVIHGRSRDLSYGGLGATLTGEIPAGTVAEIRFALPNVQREFRFPARLVHRSGFRCGLRFSALSPDQRFLIQRICLALPR